MLGEVVSFVVVAGVVLAVFFALRRSSAARMQARLATEAPPPPQRPLIAVPPPPPRPDEPIKVAASRQQAVLLRRQLPPQDETISHFGGVPLATRGFTWPFVILPDGSDRALHHLLQVDCAAIPAQARLGLLPDRGLLSFFLDLDWANHWTWSVRYESGDLDEFVPARVPAGLPRAFARGAWRWVTRNEDWPTLLPRWSCEPVAVAAAGGPRPTGDGDHDRRFWPGDLDLERAVAELDGVVVPAHEPELQRPDDSDDGSLVRPYETFPHDWQAVRITTGHLARAVERHETEDPESTAALRAGIETWSRQAYAADRWAPLTPEESDAVWDLVRTHEPVSRYVLRECVDDAVEATVSSGEPAAAVLPEDVVDLVRARHALAVRTEDGEVQVSGNLPRMLCAPSRLQGEAEERVGEWLLLLELAEVAPIGLHLGEAVLQFWIRPRDLAARRFDLVELTCSLPNR